MKLDIEEMDLPVRLRLEQPMSIEELIKFSTANDALRVEREANGEILVMSRADSKIRLIEGRIYRFLADWAKENEVGVSRGSTLGFTLPDGSIRSPNASWISHSRWNLLSDAERSGYPAICPEFVIELRAPGDKVTAAKAKMAMWIANGTLEAWLIDPERTVVYVYRHGDDTPEEHFDPSSVQGHGVVAGFELVMARVWK